MPDPEKTTLTREQEVRLDAEQAALFEDRGALLGWDPVARRPAWRIVSPDNAVDGGTLSTAGNLVFAGGNADKFIAYHAETGERLWTFTAHTGVAAGPISYAVDGEQYVAVAAGRGLQPYYQPNYSRLLAFRLGGAASLPEPAPYTPPQLNPPPSTASEQTIARGAALYGRNCAQCHDNRIGTFPDLRVSAAIHDQAAFDAIVIDGARTDAGMVSFAATLSSEDSAAIRAWVIERANTQFEEESAAHDE